MLGYRTALFSHASTEGSGSNIKVTLIVKEPRNIDLQVEHSQLEHKTFLGNFSKVLIIPEGAFLFPLWPFERSWSR